MHVHGSEYGLIIERTSRQLNLLRDAVIRHDLSEIEFHTRAVQDMLTDLDPILRSKVRRASSLDTLREAILGCAALVSHLQSTIRALSALYHSVPRDGVRY